MHSPPEDHSVAAREKGASVRREPQRQGNAVYGRVDHRRRACKDALEGEPELLDGVQLRLQPPDVDVFYDIDASTFEEPWSVCSRAAGNRCTHDEPIAFFASARDAEAALELIG